MAKLQSSPGTTPAPLFREQVEYPTGQVPGSVVVADFNGDGKPDLANISSGDNTVSVLLGNGDGTFQPHVDYATGDYPVWEAVSDFNGDGKPDLAVANDLGNTVSVLLGNGDGTFQPHMDYATGDYAVAVAAGDFNGDGKSDLAVANAGDNSVSVLLGNGDGIFQPYADYPTGNSPQSVAVGDFNGDGKPDLAVANLNEGTLSVLLGNGDGTFQAHVDYPTGVPSRFVVTVGDFNGDGKLDLVSATRSPSEIHVLLGNGDGTFQPYVDYATGEGAGSVAVGDVNGDGWPDLAGTNLYDNTVSVLLGNGDGTFQPHMDYATGNYPDCVAVGDFNNDGKPDLAVTNFNDNTVSVLINIRGAATRMQLLSSQNPSNFDQAVTFTATVTPRDQGTPTGTVGFYDGTTTLGISALDASGVVSLATSALAVGIHSITATYSGDQVFAQNTSAVSQLVQGGQPAGALIPATLNFAAEPLGITSASQNVTLANTAYIALNISSIGITGTNGSYFAQSNNCGASVPVSGSCNISVTFTPATPGSFVASLNVTDNAPDSPQTVTLTGTAVGASIDLSPMSINFPPQYVGTSGLPQTVVMTNTGNAELSVNSVTTSVADFGTLSTCTNAIQPGENCAIGVFFDPTASGTRAGTLTISDNAVGSPHTLSLSGAGQDFSLSPSGSSTATIASGQTANYTVAVNPGGGFNESVALTCSGAPAQSTCSLSSSSVTLNGSGPASATVTVRTAGTSASLATPNAFRFASGSLAQWFALSGLSGLVALGSSGGWSLKSRNRLLCGLALLCLFSIGITWSGCGGGTSRGSGGGAGGTPAGTYNLSVTGTFSSGSTNLNHSAKLTLIVR